MDRADHDQLGNPGVGHDVRAGNRQLLLASLSAGPCRSRLLSRHVALSHVLVCTRATTADRGRLRLWLLSGIYLCLTFGLYSFGYWVPKLLKSVTHYSDTRVAMISAIPYALGAIAMIVLGRHSDRTGERRFHAAISAFLAAC